MWRRLFPWTLLAIWLPGCSRISYRNRTCISDPQLRSPRLTWSSLNLSKVFVRVALYLMGRYALMKRVNWRWPSSPSNPSGIFLVLLKGLELVCVQLLEALRMITTVIDVDVDEGTLRRSLFENTGGSFPELITRGDIKLFLPPIGGLTVYCFGDPAKMSNPDVRLALRVHDECNGSDVFGSDICTCRPYLIFGVEEAVKEAQQGGSGVVIYFRKEGRALGEVTKYLVYNARKTPPKNKNILHITYWSI